MYTQARHFSHGDHSGPRWGSPGASAGSVPDGISETAWLSALPMTVPPGSSSPHGPQSCVWLGAFPLGQQTSLHRVISGPLPFCSFLLPSLLVMLLFQDSTSSGSFLLCVPVHWAFLPRTHQQLVSFFPPATEPLRSGSELRAPTSSALSGDSYFPDWVLALHARSLT